jgi:hypothetical protein
MLFRAIYLSYFFRESKLIDTTAQGNCSTKCLQGKFKNVQKKVEVFLDIQRI